MHLTLKNHHMMANYNYIEAA